LIDCIPLYFLTRKTDTAEDFQRKGQIRDDTKEQRIRDEEQHVLQLAAQTAADNQEYPQQQRKANFFAFRRV